jgi:hypothetical protein
MTPHIQPQFALIFMVRVPWRNHEPGQKKGREPVAPPSKAPRSAHPENAPSRARWARHLGWPLDLKNSRFFDEAVAEATLNIFQFVLLFHFLLLLEP